MSILEELDITKEQMEQAESSAIAKVFEPLKSGVYEATVEDIVVYKNQWDGTQMRYDVIVKDDKNEDRKLTFRTDIGQKLKDGKPNNGYAGRLEQFSHATNTPLADISKGGEVEIKVFGKATKANVIIGMKGKKVKALVRLTNDTNKAEGQSFKYTNDIAAVVALDGTEKSGEDAVAPFLANIEKAPVFEVKGKSKSKEKSDTAAVKTASGESVNDML